MFPIHILLNAKLRIRKTSQQTIHDILFVLFTIKKCFQYFFTANNSVKILHELELTLTSFRLVAKSYFHIHVGRIKVTKFFFIYFCWSAHNNIVFQFDCFKEFKDVNEEQKMRRKQQRQMIETKKWRNLLSAKEQEKNFMLSHYVLIHASQIIIKSISMPRRRRRRRRRGRTVVEEVSVYINSSRGKSKILSVLF